MVAPETNGGPGNGHKATKGRPCERLAEALGALELELSAEQLADIEAAVPPGAAAGERYNEQGMAALDSERS